MTPEMREMLDRIDDVLRDNRRTENLYLVLTSCLFLAGIACIISALVTGKFLWSTPSAVTTGLLYWPLKEIRSIRSKNIALATAPMLIATLPADEAAKELQNLLRTLYGEGR
jgi:hypothetical protein